jgi:hypothetical protein
MLLPSHSLSLAEVDRYNAIAIDRKEEFLLHTARRLNTRSFYLQPIHSEARARRRVVIPAIWPHSSSISGFGMLVAHTIRS